MILIEMLYMLLIEVVSYVIKWRFASLPGGYEPGQTVPKLGHTG